MPWNPNEIDSEILAVHAALVPSGAQGEVVLFGGDEHWMDQQESAGDNSWKKTRIYDVADHSIVPGQVQSPDSDVFCSHHVFTGDGRLLIAGGTSKWPVGDDHHTHSLDFLGHSRCWLYNPRERQWVETGRLNRNPDQPDEARSGGRWYPGLVAMGDGSAVAFMGHLDQDDSRHRNTLPERYFPGRGGWVNLPSVMGVGGEPNSGGRRYLFFPRAYVLPSGKIFSATPLPAQFDEATGIEGQHFSTAFDADSGDYTTPRAASADGVHDGWSFPAVLLPLLPNNGQYNARILYWNWAQPRWIDTDALSPQWIDAGARDAAVAMQARIHGQAVLLPTGQVCVVGGVAVTNPEDPLNQVEIYTPDITWAGNVYGGGVGAWQLMAGNSINARNYHSTALLLANGKVWVGGGNTNEANGNPAAVGIRKIELYEPDYIAVMGRILIQTAPPVLGYGQEFDVEIDRPATDIGRAALIRNGSATHSTNNDQRYVGLEIVPQSGNTIRLKAPPTGNIAPPGYYMLWVIGTDGNPCDSARFIRVAHLSCRVIADRSTFSQDEVEATGGGGSASFASALYVDFDGFISAELSGTPGFTLIWSDDSSSVAVDQVTLQFTDRYTETDPPSPDVPTRITFAFDIVFQTLGAFSGWMDGREILVTFELGPHQCATRIGLTKKANPYMIDVDPGVHNPAWLSTDVRVFKARADQPQLGATLALSPTGPWDYIREVIDNLRDGSQSFTSIQPDGPEATLDGAYMSGSQPTFNFAIAKVRYRAVTTVAEQVRCFFRICNAAATGLEFNTGTLYRSSPGNNPVPLLGTAGGQIVSIPFFNAERVNTVMGQAGAASMDSQILDANYDIQNITPASSGAEVSAYFGCYLDINTPTPRFPIAPSDEGPFSDATSLPIRDLLRSWHNCLVAEIVFADDPTRFNAGPADSDNLAQRNLVIVGLENPGASASRTAMHTFEVSPSQIRKGERIFSPTRLQHESDQSFTTGSRLAFPDELFFDWHNLPSDTEVTLYFPDIDTADIEAMLASRISAPAFTVLDDKTVRFRIGDCAWLPLPGGRDVRIPALISIALPDGIVEGQVYRVTIRQVNGATGRITGSITIEMPVSKAAFLRPEAERQLSFMGHIATTLPFGDRWKPIFDRLIAHLGSRVDALGGDSRQVQPNPDGTGKPHEPISWQPGDPFPPGGFGSGGDGHGGHSGSGKTCWEGWGAAALLALALVALGVLPAPTALLVTALAVVLFAFVGWSWARKCRGKFVCRLLDSLILGAVAAGGLLGLGAASGTQVRMAALALASLIAVGAILISYLLRCRGGCCD